MIRKKMKFLAYIIFSSFCFSFLLGTFAHAEEELTYVEEEEGTYVYQYKSGTFETNILDGDTVEIGYFSWNENLNISLMLGGKALNYENGDIIFENGDYIALIYDIASGEYSIFTFTIQNTLNMAGMNANTETEGTELTSGSEEEYLAKLVDGMEDLQGMIDPDAKELHTISLQYTFREDLSLFTYGAAGRRICTTDIPNGAVTDRPVLIKAEDNSLLLVYKDGQIVLPGEDNTFSEPGFYDVVSYVYNVDEALIPENERVENTGYYATHFVFYIVNASNNYLGVIRPPEGFHFKEILFNGKDVDLPQTEYFYVEKDGDYSFTFQASDSKLEYFCEFKRDTIAPTLTFNQELENNYAKAPIAYTMDDADAHVTVMSGDKVLPMAEGEEYSYSGWYHFRVYDDAGNENFYAVYIKRHFRFFSKGMIILMISTFAVAVIYFLLQRRGKYSVND